jgi:hypothetical protein
MTQAMENTAITFTGNQTIFGSTSDSGVGLRISVASSKDGQSIEGIKFSYKDGSVKFSQELKDPAFFQAVCYSLRGDEQTLYSNVMAYLTSLSAEETMTMEGEYHKTSTRCSLIDGFVLGLASYVSFIALHESGSLTEHIPFQFGIPSTINNGNIVNQNMFRHLTLPLTALSKVSDGIILQLVSFVQSFINMWEPLFSPGPIISSTDEARLAMEVISGISQSTSKSLAIINARMKHMEDNFQKYIECALAAAIDRLTLQNSQSISQALCYEENKKYRKEKEEQVEEQDDEQDDDAPPAPVDIPVVVAPAAAATSRTVNRYKAAPVRKVWHSRYKND